jgi:SpoVK/Ycf46/Vps4 family AAA+-type ATPase
MSTSNLKRRFDLLKKRQQTQQRAFAFPSVESKGAIMFFDEFDSFARKRGEVSTGGDDIKTELLTQIEGMLAANVGKRYQIYIIAATNFPWFLDDAILRRCVKNLNIHCLAKRCDVAMCLNQVWKQNLHPIARL